MEYRMFATFRTMWPVQSDVWEQVAKNLDELGSHYGTVVSYRPDQPSDAFDVVMSGEGENALGVATEMVQAIVQAMGSVEVLATPVRTDERTRMPLAHLSSVQIDEISESDPAIAV
ncbi:MAG TPA: hypothetical protein VIA06_00515 [Candidatus Dormibacteraeota bacterium]|jgi:hypothetical protein|nr:hypothetical protein [Candidatus Dormibacteraeota bacterium]